MVMPGLDRMTDDQKMELAKKLFLGRNASVAGAYKADPRTGLAQGIMDSAASTDPAAGGVGMGIARGLQGALGGYMAKKQQQRYAAADEGIALMDQAARLKASGGDPVATGQGVPPAIMGGPPPPPMGMPPPGGPPPGPPPTVTPNPAIAALAGGGGPGGPSGMGNPAIAKIAGALGDGGGLPPGGLPPPPGPVAGPDMATLTGKPTAPPMGTPPPNPMMAPGNPGAQAASSPNSLNRVATSLTAQPAMEDVGGLQAMPITKINEGAMREQERQRAANDKLLGPTPPVAAAPAPASVPKVTRAERRAAAPVASPAVVPAKDDFQSYDSKAYEALEEQYAAQYGIPVSMLRSIRVYGEQSNANQTSTKGAKSVYQFTPETRQSWIDKYGYDPWKSPENAVQAAAQHLGDSFKATNGDARETVTRYIAGTEGVRGRVTKAYVNRVMSGMDRIGSIETAAGRGPAGGAIPPAPQIALAPLPPVPPEPERYKAPEPIKSLRLATARNLMLDNPNASATMRMLAADPEWEAGTKEEMTSREKAYDAEVQARQDEYNSRRTLYNEEAGTAFKQPYAERNAAIGQNYTMQGKEYDAHTAALAAKIDNDAKIEAARVKAQSFKPPPWLSKQYYESVSKIEDGNSVLTALSKRPEGVGAKNYLNQALTQRTDPEGVALRAAVADYGGLLLKNRSGATVTDKEWANAAPWVPKPQDTALAIQDKMKVIMDKAQADVERIHGMSEAGGVLQYNPSSGQQFAPTFQQGTQSPGWGPTSHD